MQSAPDFSDTFLHLYISGSVCRSLRHLPTFLCFLLLNPPVNRNREMAGCNNMLVAVCPLGFCVEDCLLKKYFIISVSTGDCVNSEIQHFLSILLYHCCIKLPSPRLRDQVKSVSSEKTYRDTIYIYWVGQKHVDLKSLSRFPGRQGT